MPPKMLIVGLLKTSISNNMSNNTNIYKAHNIRITYQSKALIVMTVTILTSAKVIIIIIITNYGNNITIYLAP